MARPVDSSLTFNSSTGYTFDSAAVEFVSGSARAKSGFTGTTTIVTPAVDTSTWARLALASLFVTESAAYTHRFLLSTDDGDTWLTTDGSSYYLVDISDIAAAGLTRAQLANLRVFPELGDSLRIAIGIIKGSGGTGSIDAITLTYLLANTPADEATLPGGEPEADGNIVDDLGILPEMPVSLSFMQVVSEAITEGGYQIASARSSLVRSSFPVDFVCVGATNRDAVEAYIDAHRSRASFSWQPPWEEDERCYVFGDRTREQIAPTVWRVSSTCTEVFPP